ncbi:hypothetical protein ATK36_5124 [Amycolatopsis sulphurea]|uniref:Uncharacterized protein n=1 Tax=Amycolatopsis sulphurea TaxID=76022 RepID=A0A2A9FHD9_9PSEU|nr:hypothetical protein [Amycolatopsis sulphurea]PFG49930.1 hypothetical protein ATK36_5124 [Amycolatopsis sulphurea]
MDQTLISQIQRHFEAAWHESVQVTGMGRVTVGARRDRRVERERRVSREDGPVGCVAEFFIEVFSAITWPFVAIWGLTRLFKRRGSTRHAAIPSGPTTGRAYRVADALKQHTGDIAVVRGRTRLAIAELGDSATAPTVVWIGRGPDRPQWSPAPASLYWDDGSMLMLADTT